MEIKIEGTMNEIDLTQDVLQMTPCKLRMEEPEPGIFEYTGEIKLSIKDEESKGKIVIYSKTTNPPEENVTNIKEMMQRQARELLIRMASAEWN